MKNRVKQRDFNDVTYKDVHDTIFPADVRETDLIYAKIRGRDSGHEFMNVRVWKLSPLGIEIVTPPGFDLDKGTLLDLQLQVGRQNTLFEGLVVEITTSNPVGKSITGIRLSRSQPSRTSNLNRRQSTRWICSSQFYPVAVAPNPVQFNDFLYFKIRDISSAGLRVLTSLRNKFIITGMTLSLQVSFPITGTINVEVEVKRANLAAEDGKDFLELGLEFSNLSKHHREILGQYVLQFSDAESLDEIRKQGLYPNSLTSGVDYSYVKTESDFRAALELRLNANLEADKVPEDYTIDMMADIYDARSRILLGRYNGNVVGTMRATFCEDDEAFEIEDFIKLPSNFPRRDQIVEIGRAATSPNYRRSDLWYSMIQHISIMAVQAGRPFGIASTTPNLVSMYERLGFRCADISYIHPLYPEQTQVVMTIDIHEVLPAKNVGVIAWNIVWKEVADYLLQNNIGSATKYRSSKARIYRLLSPVAILQNYFSKRPRKSSKPAKKRT